MGWEVFYKARYFYLITRENGRIVRRYVGRGLEAERLDHEIQQRKQKRLDRYALQDKIPAAEQPLIALAESYHNFYVKYKYSLGFHISSKRQWRKRRASLVDMKTQLEKEAARREYDTTDELTLIKRYGALPATTALECLLATLKMNEKRKLAYRKAFDRLKRKLLAPGDGSMLERLTASRIALDWIDVHIADAWFYLSVHDPDLKLQDFLDRRRTRADRRLTRSIKTLADLQRISIDAIRKKIPTNVKLVG